MLQPLLRRYLVLLLILGGSPVCAWSMIVESGNTVVIDHGLGLYSLFAHLSRIDVAEGTSVDRGFVVGLVGATGRVTGPHLHWTIRAGGARVDPMAVIAILR